MKNKFLFILLFLTCSLVLTSCVMPTSEVTPTPEVTPTVVPTEPTVAPTTDVETETVVDERYSVKVVYPDSSPVTSGVTVQWCEGDMCYVPQAVNQDGVAYIELEDGEYYIHLNNVPTGYTYNPNAYTTNEDNKNIIIPLFKIEDATGEGSKTSPYVVNKGTYSISFDAAGKTGMKYFSFTAPKAGSFVIESICMDKLALTVVDPTLGYIGTDIEANPNSSGTTVKDSVNFSYSIQAEANTTYYFVVMIASVKENNKEVDKYPVTVEFNITELL